MTQLRDRIPEPPKSWTETHEPGDVLEGIVAERIEREKDGRDLVIIKVQANGSLIDLPCFRSDLQALGDSVAVGDAVAVKFWGEQGKKFVYTFVSERGGQETLSTKPGGEDPPLAEEPAF